MLTASAITAFQGEELAIRPHAAMIVAEAGGRVVLSQALLYGLAASSALVIGAVVGSYLKVPKRLVAVALAFASGSLTAALAFELFSEAFRQGEVNWSGLGFVLGASVFALTDALLDRFTDRGGDESAFALLAGVTLDGVPENIALGITLLQASAGGGGGGIALLFVIFASNLPEALSSADKLTSGGRSTRFAIGIWVATAFLLAASVVLGTTVFRGVGDEALAVMLAFAAGAVLASLADTLMPEAYRDGGSFIAFATAAGFLISFVLSES
jgi:ZIP family zinc transporter